MYDIPMTLDIHYATSLAHWIESLLRRTSEHIHIYIYIQDICIIVVHKTVEYCVGTCNEIYCMYMFFIACTDHIWSRLMHGIWTS